VKYEEPQNLTSYNFGKLFTHVVILLNSEQEICVQGILLDDQKISRFLCK